MFKGKHAKHNLSKRPGLLLASLLLIFTVTTIGTVAFLVAEANTVENTFTAGTVPNQVVEKINGTEKNNVAIKNMGTVDAYVRALVVASWVKVDDQGVHTGEIYGTMPVEGTDYTISWTKNGWVKGADGFYYYTQPVGPKGVTGELFTKCNAVENAAPAGYTLSVEILGQTIQADGKTDAGIPVVESVWSSDKVQVKVGTQTDADALVVTNK